MMNRFILAAGLLAAAVLPANAHAPSKQPKHLLIDVICGGYELWYQDNSVWGAHGSCGAPNVVESGLIARMDGQKYIIVTATYPDGGLTVTTRFTMPKDGQGEFDTYATDGTSAPAHQHGTYTSR
jgi:hypothetical protein